MELMKVNPKVFNVSDSDLKMGIMRKLDCLTGTLENGIYRDEVKFRFGNKFEIYYFELPCTEDFKFDASAVEVKRVR